MKSSSIKRLLALLCLVLLCSGCFRITYKLDNPPGDTYEINNWNQYFIFGLIPNQDRYKMSELCPAGELIELRSYNSPSNVIATVLGILTAASTVEAVCYYDKAISDKSSKSAPIVTEASPKEKKYFWQ